MAQLVESQPKTLRLTAEQAHALITVGRRLAASRDWWGHEDEPREPSVIQCIPSGPETWTVTVANAIGVVQAQDLTLVVEPKVPLPHLIHLLAASGDFPRLDETPAALSAGSGLWQLVAEWYVRSTERLVRQGLARDYREETGRLPAVRGRVDGARTVTMLLRGAPEFTCRHEEYDFDGPLNRVLRAAAIRVALSPGLPAGLARRSRRIASAFDEAGSLRPTDLLAQPERHNTRYLAAFQLARQVLRSSGRDLADGQSRSWTFLLPTPGVAEKGLRQILARRLHPDVSITKQGIRLRGAAWTLTPDLRFARPGEPAIAVGDVKYTLATGQWRRSDLYQLVTFATGFNVNSAVRIAMTTGSPVSGTVHVGDVTLNECLWNAREDVSPLAAEDQLVGGVRSWLAAVGSCASA
jgi:5-methylcytosine-specific restriction enzyme subunit McrC